MLMDDQPTRHDQPPSPAVIVREARKKRGWTQAELAERVKTTQQTIGKIEKGVIKQSPLFPAIALELEVSLATLIPSLPRSAFGGAIPGSQLVTGDRDLPVFAATEGGRGAVILSTDPVDWVARPEPLARVKDGYGIYVIEESMFPEFKSGDIALVHPHLPPTIGATCIFYAEAVDGTVKATIKCLRRETKDSWLVRQWNPPDDEKADFALAKAEWQKCHVTVGKYSRR